MEQKYTNCPNCKNPILLPELGQFFTFPADIKSTFDFIERKFNAITCPLCNVIFNLVDIVTIYLPSEEIFYFLIPPENQILNEELERIAPKDVKRIVFDKYDDMRTTLLTRLNPLFVPIIMSILSGEFEKLTRQEQVEQCTPIFLRIFKSMLDGYIPFYLQFNKETSEAEKRQFLEGLFVAIVSEQIQRVGKEAARKRDLLSLPNMLRQYIPIECINSEILSSTLEGCLSLDWAISKITENPLDFSIAIRQEYLNALVHSYAQKSNPREEDWATYLCILWRVNKLLEGSVDPQLLMNKEIVQNTISFRSLWNAFSKVFALGKEAEIDELKENLSVLEELMKHYGYDEKLFQTMQEGVIRISDPEHLTEQQKSLFAETYKDVLLKYIVFNKSKEDSWGAGVVTGGTIYQLLQQSLREEAISVGKALLDHAAQIGDDVAKAAIGAFSVEALNNFGLFQEAGEFAIQVMEVVDKDNSQGAGLLLPYQLIHCLNEVGNCFRYAHHYDEALNAYSIAEKLLEVAPSIDDEDRENRRKVLHHNLAIVHRSKGEYKLSQEVLLAELERYPNDHMLLASLATLFGILNRYEDAIECFNKAIESTEHHLGHLRRAQYLAGRGYLKYRLGQTDEGFWDVVIGYNLLPADAMEIKVRFAANAMNFYPESQEGKEFITECEELLKKVFEGETIDESLLITAIVQYCDRLLRAGRINEARATIWPYIKWLVEIGQSRPWRLSHTLGWILYELGRYEESWVFIQETIAEFEEDVPEASEAIFAPFWMQDKAEFQNNIARIMIDLIRRGIADEKFLLSLFEFMNGREIIARLRHDGEAEAYLQPDILIDLFVSNLQKQSKHIECFFFIETSSSIYLVNLSSTRRTVEFPKNLQFDPIEIGNLKQVMATSLKRANPSNLTVLDDKMKIWVDLGQRLGQVIAPYLRKDTHVCFYPGRALTGFPLHLIQLPKGETLIEVNTVSYAPNLTTFLKGLTSDQKSASSSITLVSVTKTSDDDAFRERALSSANRILSHIPEETKHLWLKEVQADRKAILQAMQESREIVFQCHGTTAGSVRGYGICIADDGILPPSILSVSEQPDHARFILTWQDIEKSPELFVSIACSSGITEVTASGVRYGLEQTLFSSGTKIIISPLWDVEQNASLTWLEHFYQIRYNHPEMHIEQIFQKACLATREHFPHFYFWGAFVLNGSIL